MTSQAEEREPPIVQSFSSDLEDRIRENNHHEDVSDRKSNRRIRLLFSCSFAIICVIGFGVASYGVIWHEDAKVRETMAATVWTPLSAIAGLLAGMALK